MLKPVPMLLQDNAVVAFYGLRICPDALCSCYGSLTSWAGSKMDWIDELAVHRAGTFGRYRPFRTSDTRLRDGGFQNVTGFSFRSYLPDEPQPTVDYLLEANVSASDFSASVAANTSVARLDDSLFVAAEIIVRCLVPEYGVGFVRPRRTGPSMYALGITLGQGPVLNDREEAEKTGRWGMEGMTEGVQQGLLREIYEWNFLTARHLDTLVDGKPLARWISERPDRGKVVPVGDRMWLWTVDPAATSAIYEAIDRAGMIYHCTW